VQDMVHVGRQARIPGNRPIRIASIERRQPRFELGGAVLEQQQVLMTKDDVSAPRLIEQAPKSAVGVERIASPVVYLQEFGSIGREAVFDEARLHRRILFHVRHQGADGKDGLVGGAHTCADMQARPR